MTALKPERMPAHLRYLIALLLVGGLAGCAPTTGLDSSAGTQGPGLPECTGECTDDDDDDDDDDGGSNGGGGSGGGGSGDDDCDDDADDGGAADDPTFLCEADDAPSLAETKVMFYAVRGEARSGSLWYHPVSGQTDSVELVRLELGPNSLLTHPGGSPVVPGDSVLITIEVLEQDRGIIWFQPAGLGFSAADPAVLTFGYGQTDDDINGDGVVDATDEALEPGLALWRQETEADPFTPVPSQVDQSLERVSAGIDGFTRYAVAY